ncbi:MAG: nickel pincer cofactor biosynthesis protein LarC [Liquorilactobacillus nagelii]|uniref:nickel pincer cofactor biosynthesis protein LarC n=1 Tax=Liquorilactobacillus nagelii TaxID=82688 RepID=UPI0039EC145A
MKTLVLDAFSGISGDMFLGALFDLGLSKTALEEQLAKLKVTGYQLLVDRTSHSSIYGTNFDVILADHQVKDNGITEHGHHHGRSFATIKQLIEASELSDSIKQRAVKLFQEIAVAEAHVHHQKVSEVHFHEVGAIDSIVDLVGAAIALDLMKIDRIVVNNLADGTGTIKIAHGIVPVPVPAVMQLRVGTKIPIHLRSEVTTELITPTGMALVKCLASEFDTTPSGILERTGYGFGNREIGSLNALRASIYNTLLSNQSVEQEQDQVMLIETNLDDVTGEQLADGIAGLIERGAKDAWSEPIMMKKGRPAYKLCLLADPAQRKILVKYLFAKTPAIGVRYQLLKREIMQRKVKLIKTSYGKLHVKQLTYGEVTKLSLEHQELAKLATLNQRPLVDLRTEILAELRQIKQKKGI